MARAGPPAIPTVPRTLPGVASRSYTVASTWEQLAVLSEEQERAIDTISQSCAERPVPPSIAASARETEAKEQGDLADEEPGISRSNDASLEAAVLENSSQFHRWHSELEAARVLGTEEKFQHYAETLKSHLAALDELQSKVQSGLQLCEELKSQHAHVASKSKALHTSCEKLVSEKDKLVNLVEAIKRKLAYFNELDNLAAKFHSTNLSIESEDFLSVLKRLDECLTYVTTHPQYADSASYAAKFRLLQQRALSGIRSKAHQILRHAADQVEAAIKEQAPATPRTISKANGLARQTSGQNGVASPNGEHAGASEVGGAESTLLYVRFRAAAESGLRGLLQGVESRSQRPEYAQLLSDCQRMYCEIRLMLVGNSTLATIRSHANEPLPALTRKGWLALIQVCQMETQLFEHLFPGTHTASGAMAPLIDSLADMLYDTLRPAYIHLQDLGSLCQLVQILKHEILEEQIERRAKSVGQLRTVLLRTIADVQHRLTYRAQAFIKESVTGFQPKPEDLAYPQLLATSKSNSVPQKAKPTDHKPQSDAAPQSSAEDRNGGAQLQEIPPPESGAQSMMLWYPPLRETVLCLGRLYRCLEVEVFGGLAQDAITACTAALQRASSLIAQHHGIMDGQLFLIKQLLILREQIAPYESEFSHVEKDLDFSHTRNHIRRIMAGQASLFSLQLVTRGGPRILENQVDSKKEAEKLLKATCEMFILSVTKLTVDPMLSFITKVTTVRHKQKNRGLSNVTSGPPPPEIKPLREQAFALPEKVVEMIQKVRESLSGRLPDAVDRMKMYLEKPATHAILFRPIKSNIVEAHGQIAAVLEADYTKEEVASFNLPSPQELSGLLDKMC